MDINKRCQSLPILHSKKIEWTEGGKKDNVITLPYPKYDQEITLWIKTFSSLELADKNYPEHIKELDHKPFSKLTRDETLSLITSIIRAERFSTGALAEAIENGRLEALCIHLHEVTRE